MAPTIPPAPPPDLAHVPRWLNEVRRDERKACDVAGAFGALAAWWHRDCGHLSSVTKRRAHPAYRAVVALGELAVPILLDELALERDGEWDGALRDIVGYDPLPDTVPAGNMRAIRAAWLAWGERRRDGLVTRGRSMGGEVDKADDAALAHELRLTWSRHMGVVPDEPGESAMSDNAWLGVLRHARALLGERKVEVSTDGR